MLGIIGSIFGLRRSISTGIAIAALLVALGPYLPKSNAAQQTAPQSVQQTAPQAVQQTAPQAEAASAAEVVQEGAAAAEVPDSAQQKLSSFKENMKQLELDENGFNWSHDWWKYMLMAAAFLLIAYFALKITNMLFRTAIVILCVAFSLIGALLLSPFVTPFLNNLLAGKLPDFLAPSYISHALCFLVCYLVLTAITNSVRKPANKQKKNDD